MPDRFLLNRPWMICEQSFTDQNIQYHFEFGSVHSEEIANGNDAPDHDREIFMRMWSPDGQKCLKIVFDRGGAFVRSEIDDGTLTPAQREEAAAALPEGAYNPLVGGPPAPAPRDGDPDQSDLFAGIV